MQCELMRQRAGSENFIVQEVDGMYVVKLFCSLDELNSKVKERLSDADREKIQDCCFLPIKIGVRDNDLTVEATFVTTR